MYYEKYMKLIDENLETYDNRMNRIVAYSIGILAEHAMIPKQTIPEMLKNLDVLENYITGIS